MPLVSLRQVLDHAAENGYGVRLSMLTILSKFKLFCRLLMQPTARLFCKPLQVPANMPVNGLPEKPDRGCAGELSASADRYASGSRC